MSPKRIKRDPDLDPNPDVQIVYETLRHPDYENLPEVVMREIFSYLNARDLRRASSTCTRWNLLCKYSDFWNRVDLQGLNLTKWEILTFLDDLPCYITHLRIYFDNVILPGEFLPLVSEILGERCPRLEVLHFENCVLRGFHRPTLFSYLLSQTVSSTDNGTMAYLYDLPSFQEYARRAQNILHFPESLRVLRFINTEFESDLTLSLFSSCHLPNIEILDFTQSCISCGCHPSLFDTFPRLKELYITHGVPYRSSDNVLKLFLGVIPKLRILRLNSIVKGKELKMLQSCGQNLVQLHLCNTKVRDVDLIFITRDTFPNLKLICFECEGITEKRSKKLLECCKSLKGVFDEQKIPDDNLDMDVVLLSNVQHRCDQILKRRNYF